MSDIRKYVQLLESNYKQVITEQTDDDCYLFSYDAELLYESSGISLDVLMENRIDWLRDNIMHKLEPVADKEGKSVEELFNWIIDQDPSTKKQYSQWLMKILVGKNAQSSLSDLEQAKNVLTKYEELKKSKALKPEHKDLNQFKSIDELSQAISDTEQNIKSEYDAIEQRARNESEIIHEDNVWVVVLPKTEYAAGYWGKKSLWCTAAGFEGGRQEERSNNMFNRYSERGNLYTIVNKKKPSDIYQIHLATKQFMDSENKKLGEIEDRKKIIDHFPKLKDMIFKEILGSGDMIFSLDNYKNIFGDMTDDDLERLENNVHGAKDSYFYARGILRGRFVKGEDVIATSPEYSYEYAYGIIKGKFEKGEDAISTSSEYSYLYAKNVIEGRFKKGEDAISENPELSYNYANYELGGRFEKGEDTIASDSWYSYLYAKNVIEGRFEKGEDVIARDGNDSNLYAIYVIKGRFEKGEDAIANSPGSAYNYAMKVLKGRFKKGEDIMSREFDRERKDQYYQLTGIRL